MKKYKTNLYSPVISATLSVISLVLASSAVGCFLGAFIYSFLIKKALIPTGKKVLWGQKGFKLYYEARGELHIYRKQLIRIYWFFFILGIGSLIFLR